MGFLRSDAIVRGSYRWTRGGTPSGWINITANLPNRFIELNYNYGDKPVSYRVQLESILKHFGGCEWYFICPATGKRCRTLGGIGEYFLSRFAYPDAMYSKQTQSKHLRDLSRAFELDELAEKFFNRRYVRTTYKGKPTKRYQRFLNGEERVFTTSAFRRFVDRDARQNGS